MNKNIIRAIATLTFLVVMAAVAGCTSGDRPGSAEAPTLRITWWGSDSRTAATQAALDLYTERHPEVTFVVEPASFSGYFDRLGTQVAAQDAPGIVQMQYLYLTEYAQRGSLVPLDQFSPAPINLDLYDKVIGNQGVIGGTRYAVPAGANTQTVLTSTEAFRKAGVELPGADWTWDDFEEIAEKLVASGVVDHAAGDFTHLDWVFDYWLSQHGGTFYSEDGRLGFSAEQLAEYWAWGEELRAKKYLPPMTVTAEVGDLETYPVATGAAAMDFIYSAQITGFDGLIPSGVEPVPFPTGDQPAQYVVGTGMAWVVMANSEYPELAADVIAFLTSDPEAIALQGMERGAPLTGQGRDELAKDATGATARTISFTEEVLGRPTAPDSVFYNRPPLGASQVSGLFTTHAQLVGFGKLSAEAAARDFIAAATKELDHAR